MERNNLDFDNHVNMMDYINTVIHNWTYIDYDSYEKPVHRTNRKMQNELGERIRFLSKLCQERILDLMKQIKDDKYQRIQNRIIQIKTKTQIWKNKKETKIGRLKRLIAHRI